MCLSEIDCEARFNMYSQERKMRHCQRRGIKIQIFYFFFSRQGGRKRKRDQRGRRETAEELYAKCRNLKQKSEETSEHG